MSNKELDPEFLINAYANGYFPMPDPMTDEILWYDPDPRCIIPFDEFHVSRSLKKTIKKEYFQIKLNTAFEAVMRCCADRPDTWINEEFIRAYSILHRARFAHSLEVWQNKKLLGGVYGVSIGGVFCAESMFHKKTDYSKIAIYYLIKQLQLQKFDLLEVQFINPHIKTLGAKEIPKKTYHQILEDSLKNKRIFSPSDGLLPFS